MWYHEIFDTPGYKSATKQGIPRALAFFYSINPIVTALVSFGLGFAVKSWLS